MIVKIELELSNDFDIMDIIAAFHYSMQIGEEEMIKKELKVFAEIIKDIRTNDPSINLVNVKNLAKSD